MAVISGQAAARPPLLGVSEKAMELREQLEVHSTSSQNLLLYGQAGTEKLSCVDFLTSDIDPFGVAHYSPLSAPDQAARILIIDPFESLQSENEPPIAEGLRVIALSNLPLKEHLGSIRADVCRCLNFAEIYIPPLRERREDILLYMNHYIQAFCENKNVHPPDLHLNALIQMIQYEWPGNLAELEKVMMRAFLEPAKEIKEFQDIPRIIPEPFPALQPLSEAVSWLEKKLLILALNRFDGNHRRAAEVLGISEPNLRYKMKKLQIRKQFVAE